MVGGAVQAEVDTERHGRPCRVLLTTIKANLHNSHRVSATTVSLRNAESRRPRTTPYLVGRLGLQFLEDLQRLLLRREGTHLVERCGLNSVVSTRRKVKLSFKYQGAQIPSGCSLSRIYVG